jgi:hypothetical protein
LLGLAVFDDVIEIVSDGAERSCSRGCDLSRPAGAQCTLAFVKKDVLEQIVDDYLQLKGYFTTHNVRFGPRKGIRKLRAVAGRPTRVMHFMANLE